jgi:hypothetical protein
MQQCRRTTTTTTSSHFPEALRQQSRSQACQTLARNRAGAKVCRFGPSAGYATTKMAGEFKRDASRFDMHMHPKARLSLLLARLCTTRQPPTMPTQQEQLRSIVVKQISHKL